MQAQDFRIKMWDEKQLPVLALVPHGPIATLTVTDLSNAVRLPLADAIPTAGSRVLKLAYAQDPDHMAQASSRLSVASGVVEGMFRL